METYIAMLRGINVSGQKKIRMEDLKEYLEAIGFKNVRTYIQSGNVVFENEKASPFDLTKQIETNLLKKLGFQVPVLVKNTSELEHILNNNTFVNDKSIDMLHVTFLSEKPKPELLDKLEPFERNADEFVVAGDAIYLCCPHGYGRTKLTNNFFENKLKVMATTRNWKTVLKLAEMARNQIRL